MIDKPSSYIVCAANRNSAGLIVCGARHYDSIMHSIINATGGRESWKNCEQGFIDQFGTFLTREEALIIAKNNNQIRRRCGGDEQRLYSENLY